MDDDTKMIGSAHDAAPQRKTVTLQRWYLDVILVIFVAILAFAMGVTFEKHHMSTRAITAAANRQSGFGGAAGGRGINRNGGIGQVTAATASSVTVADQRSGTTKTYTIMSSTTITNNGATATASDIAVGDTVLVTTDSSTSTTATRIAINPNFGGGMGVPTNDSTNSSN